MIRTLKLVFHGSHTDGTSDGLQKGSRLLTEFPYFQRVFDVFDEMPKHRGREDDQV